MRQSTGNRRFMTSAFPRFEFHFVLGSDWEKSCSQNALFFVFRKRVFSACFSAYVYCRFLSQKSPQKSWCFLQSVLILISDLSVWIRIRRRLTGLKGSRRSYSTLENRTASTEHFSSQISVNFATLRKNPVLAN